MTDTPPFVRWLITKYPILCIGLLALTVACG